MRVRFSSDIPDITSNQQQRLQVSNPLCSNKTKDFKGQNDSTQTIDEINDFVSPDCSLTEKIGNNYIWTDIGLLDSFMKSLDLLAPRKNIQFKKTSSPQSLSSQLPRILLQTDDISSACFYQHCGLQQLLRPFLIPVHLNIDK